MGSYLGKFVKVKIDRSLGSKHHKHKFIYSFNYGFVPDTTAGGGEEIDIYILNLIRELMFLMKEALTLFYFQLGGLEIDKSWEYKPKIIVFYFFYFY